MEISEITMETFTLGTAIGLNMTHDAAVWNRASLVEVKLSQNVRQFAPQTIRPRQLAPSIQTISPPLSRRLAPNV